MSGFFYRNYLGGGSPEIEPGAGIKYSPPPSNVRESEENSNRSKKRVIGFQTTEDGRLERQKGLPDDAFGRPTSV